MTRDSRVKPKKRILVFHLIDYTPVPFSNNDIEWIAEQLEDRMKEKFDIEIDNTEIDNND